MHQSSPAIAIWNIDRMLLPPHAQFTRHLGCLITFCVSRRWREMYCGHAGLCVYLSVCLSVCLSVRLSTAACPHYCTDPDVTWGSGRGCPLVVHYWADLQSEHGLRRYGNTRNVWHSLVVIRQAHCKHYACRRRLPSPAIKSTHLLHAQRYLQRGHSISSILRGCCNANAKCSEYMLVLALCLVI